MLAARITRIGLIFGLGAMSACGNDPRPADPDPEPCLQALPAQRPHQEILLNVAHPAASDEQPIELEPGQGLQVNVEGAPISHSVALIGPIRTADDLGDRVSLKQIQPGRWQAVTPRMAGSYRAVVIVDATTVSQVDLEVVATPLSLCVNADDVDPSAIITVNWTGPGIDGDRIELFDPVLNRPVLVAPASIESHQIGGTMMELPNQAGLFDVRYVSAEGGVLSSVSILAWRRSETALLRAPEHAMPGAAVSVQWIAPPRRDHRFRIIHADTGAEISVSDPVSSGYGPVFAEMITPASAGRYEIVYSNPQVGPAAARRTIVVTADAQEALEN